MISVRSRKLDPAPTSGRRIRSLLTICATGALVPLLHLLTPAAASASTRQISIFQDGGVTSTPGSTLQEIRHLGAGMVRVQVYWASIAPSPTSKKRPNFNATNPGAYPAGGWAAIDDAVRAASSDGIKVMLTITAPAPAWAQGAGKPGGTAGAGLQAWKPSAPLYGQFVKAVATRYSGHYRPAGQRTALPKVSYWEIFNEPNFIEDLAPVSSQADMYRGLLAAAWPGLKGHGNTVLFGSLAFGGGGETAPLAFVRQLYCLDGGYHSLRGRTASQHGCPSKGGFRAKNPALFSAGGFAMHPYPLAVNQTVPPNRTRAHNPDFVAFSQLPNLVKSLDRVTKAYGSGKRFNVWNDEYGYITNPPNSVGVTLSNQALYLNWAEYLSWKNPRIASFHQFLLGDPPPKAISGSGFDSGLLTYTGVPKPAYNAWRLPLYLPVSATRKGRSLEVWGCVRPAQYAARDTHQKQVGHIQFRANGSAGFKNIGAPVTFRNPNGSCYFDRHIKFPSSGTVQITYQYPSKDKALLPTIANKYSDPLASYVSRPVSISVR